MPTSAAWDAANSVMWVSQLGGKILAAPAALQAEPAAPMAASLVLDLTTTVAHFGYHGLASIAVMRGFLFAA